MRFLDLGMLEVKYLLHIPKDLPNSHKDIVSHAELDAMAL